MCMYVTTLSTWFCLEAKDDRYSYVAVPCLSSGEGDCFDCCDSASWTEMSNSCWRRRLEQNVYWLNPMIRSATGPRMDQGI